jgi:hypothetical protein
MMSMAVTMHPIWQSGAVILVGGVAGALIMQILVQRLLPVEVRRAHRVRGRDVALDRRTEFTVSRNVDNCARRLRRGPDGNAGGALMPSSQWSSGQPG